MAPSYPMGNFPAEMPPGSARILAISSNKGGVGKTTVATNLAVYLRALREDLPVLLVGLDDQRVVDQMFALRPQKPGEGNLKQGWAERNLRNVIQLGQYGVHFVPSPPDLTLLKARAEDPRALTQILRKTGWEGLVILDTKSDLEALTRNACCAADRVLIPVSDRSSLEQAGKSFALLERLGGSPARGRVLVTLVDRRVRSSRADRPLLPELLAEVRQRGWPYYKTHISRSPRVEALNSGQGRPLSVLHHARGTAVHGQLRELAVEILQDLELGSEAGGLGAGAWGGGASPPVRPVRVRPLTWLGALRGR